jgi:FSR family fosmidomycin resistance protein-like MFS transporter
LILSATLLCRSIIFYGLNTFLPLFWINALNQSKAAGGTALTLLMASSIGGNLLGGRAADRFGFRAVAITGFICLMVLLPLLALAKSVAMATVLLIPIGLAFSVPTSPLVVLGQQYLPNRVGLASGVTLGLAFSFGGILMPVLGRIADLYGLHAAISTVAVIPVVCTALTLALPKPKVQSST